MLKRVGTVGLLLVAAIGAYVTFRHWRTKNVGEVERGRRVADANGCFTCHGAGGFHGMRDPGYGLDDVPSWSGGLMTMYAESEGEIREWILDGLPIRVRKDPKQMQLRRGAAILMPAWRGRLSESELRGLVAYVKAVSDFETPKDEKAAAGQKTASSLGCFNCHGPQGRGSPPNPGSFKGYIPSWDGADFPDLARDDGEIREWVLDGTTRRFQANFLARFFLERQSIHMPAYRSHIKDSDLDRIVDYIHWLRVQPNR